jgi:hypothetical protein
MASQDKLPIPQKLTEYTSDMRLTNYFKQLHDKITELNQRITDLEGP